MKKMGALRGVRGGKDELHWGECVLFDELHYHECVSFECNLCEPIALP